LAINQEVALNFVKLLALTGALCLLATPANACRGNAPRALEAFRELRPTFQNLVGGFYSSIDEISFAGADSCGRPIIEWLAGELAWKANQGDIVLMGEIHDNPYHHRIRGAFLRAFEELRNSGRLTYEIGSSVTFEQLSTDKQTVINDDAITNAAHSVDDLLKAIDWASSGWAQYDYRPLFDAALATKMPIYAGDVPKPLIRQAAKQGESAVPPEERARLKLDAPLPASQSDAILTELEASHCGMMPNTAFGGMAFAQRLRDATLADVALKAHAAHGSAIVMAGNGHVRGDRGIAWYIRQREPNVKVVTVALVEVEDGKTDPAAYVPRDPEGRPAVDYVVFTPKHVRPDPCDAFKKKP
jgi:uncharacterized iron-regulated protein